ncbi:TetR/AcrR family transcriptional regulator [Streptomyces sp. NBC_01808]|uniref:TetR/AcrR family transcriptional regulator n=1 Tax=Streptomyces sp. NBC_01808 TaxID=2975947 RepID=UPI002DD88388|nr:helix-turn-helix domain-containing protein [Streptomyces sp. NBC_01808]WSA36279.1 TetR/AcrR family transcriptional regulator [Streptomyces sp. NBC_01808]
MAYLAAEERRRQIVDAAVEVMATEGIEGATTRKIAERAGAPLGAIHYCFRNKEELIHLVMDRGAAMLEEAFARVDPGRGVEATLRAGVAALWDWYRRDIGLQMALTEAGMARIRRGGDPAEVYAIWDPFGRTLLTDSLRRAVEAEGREPAVPVAEIVRFVLHRFDGMTLEYAATRDLAACGRQVDLLADAMVALALPGTGR